MQKRKIISTKLFVILTAMSQEYHLKCPKCGHEFDISYDPLNSFSDPDAGIIIREGTHRFAAKCPSCRRRSHYHMSDEGEQLSTW